MGGVGGVMFGKIGRCDQPWYTAESEVGTTIRVQNIKEGQKIAHVVDMSNSISDRNVIGNGGLEGWGKQENSPRA